jgi:eukaryotic-like serine/threonine-protein kinase
VVTSQNPQQRPTVSPDQGALREARNMLMMLGTRATSVKGTIERMRQEQSRMGLGLRGDIATSLRQMEFHLDEAEAAIRSGDVASAKSSLNSAEKQLEKLETFTGR